MKNLLTVIISLVFVVAVIFPTAEFKTIPVTFWGGVLCFLIGSGVAGLVRQILDIIALLLQNRS